MSKMEQMEGPTPEFNPMRLTPEQENDHPKEFWNKFFEKNVPELAGMIKASTDFGGSEYSNFTKAVRETLHEIPTKKKELVSGEELAFRALQYYSERNGGFGTAVKIRKEYENLRGRFIEKYAEEFVASVTEKIKDKDYNEVNSDIEVSLREFSEKMSSFPPDEINSLRNDIWERFGSIHKE